MLTNVKLFRRLFVFLITSIFIITSCTSPNTTTGNNQIENKTKDRMSFSSKSTSTSSSISFFNGFSSTDYYSEGQITSTGSDITYSEYKYNSYTHEETPLVSDRKPTSWPTNMTENLAVSKGEGSYSVYYNSPIVTMQGSINTEKIEYGSSYTISKLSGSPIDGETTATIVFNKGAYVNETEFLVTATLTLSNLATICGGTYIDSRDYHFYCTHYGSATITAKGSTYGEELKISLDVNPTSFQTGTGTVNDTSTTISVKGSTKQTWKLELVEPKIVLLESTGNQTTNWNGAINGAPTSGSFTIKAYYVNYSDISASVSVDVRAGYPGGGGGGSGVGNTPPPNHPSTPNPTSTNMSSIPPTTPTDTPTPEPTSSDNCVSDTEINELKNSYSQLSNELRQLIQQIEASSMTFNTKAPNQCGSDCPIKENEFDKAWRNYEATQQQIADAQKIEEAIKVVAFVGLLFATPLGAEIGVAYEVQQILNMIRLAAPEVKAILFRAPVVLAFLKDSLKYSDNMSSLFGNSNGLKLCPAAGELEKLKSVKGSEGFFSDTWNSLKDWVYQMVGKGKGISNGLKEASNGLIEVFSGGSVLGKTIIEIREILLRDGFTQTITQNKSGYFFQNSLGEEVRIMSRGGGWDIRIRNKFGNYLDSSGNVASPSGTHNIWLNNK